MFRDDPFWGDNEAVTSHNLIELMELIEPHITIRVQPFARDLNNKISIPQFELSDRPSDETIEKMQKLHGGYDINIYENTVPGSRWKYLMRIGLLQYYNDIHLNDWHEGSYNIYNKDYPNSPLVIVPFKSNEFDDSIMPQMLAKEICRKITEKFNNCSEIDDW